MGRLKAAGILLAGIIISATPNITAQAQAQDSSFKEVMPEAENFQAVASGARIVYYRALDKKGKLIGVVFKTSSKGYSSIIETLVGMTKDGKITAIKVISQKETRGVGSRVAKENFTEQFKGKDGPTLSGVEAVTGATISSSAVINSVKIKAREIQELIKNE